MKKIYAYTKTLLLAVVVLAAFTSCDDDASLAYNLEGVWQGSITGNYYYDRYGMTADEFDTEMMFRQYGSWEKGGEGYEIDYNIRTRSTSKVWFDWYVRDGRIYLDYDDGYRVVIRDFETYYLGGRMRFRGYFDNARTGEQMAAFNLVKVESPNDYFDNYYSRSDSI